MTRHTSCRDEASEIFSGSQRRPRHVSRQIYTRHIPISRWEYVVLVVNGGAEMDDGIRQLPIVLEGVVNHRGRPITSRSTAGGWTSAAFIIGVEMAKKCAYFGVYANLISYLTGPLGQSTAAAAANVNVWSGAASMLPLLGGFLADAYIGRYRTIVFASFLYVLGLAMLTLSATVPFLRPPTCGNTSGVDTAACAPTQFQLAFFFFSLYLMAVAEGGYKPCLQAFGADQFDDDDPEECASRSSFFNWRFFGICGAITLNHPMITYVQDNVGWGLGFGLPCAYTVIALVTFLTGTRTYRYYCVIPSHDHERPSTGLARECTQMWNALKNQFSSDRMRPGTKEEVMEAAKKSLLQVDPWSVDDYQYSSLSNKQDIKECKVEMMQELLRLFPIGASCLMFAVGLSQISTLFTKQGSTLDRRIGQAFLVPPATLQSSIGISTIIFIPIYDRVIVPFTKSFTGVPSGMTVLQRVGVGLVLSVVAMAVAALVEMRRLQTARDFGLMDLPKATVPMSLWWLLPQYLLNGISDALVSVGLQEFFYDQVPNGLRSLGLALYLSIFGVGSFISTLLVMVIDKVSGRSGESWFSDNLNRAHFDYFYWLLVGLGTVHLLFFLYFARAFRYKRKGNGVGYVGV